MLKDKLKRDLERIEEYKKLNETEQKTSLERTYLDDVNGVIARGRYFENLDEAEKQEIDYSGWVEADTHALNIANDNDKEKIIASMYQNSNESTEYLSKLIDEQEETFTELVNDQNTEFNNEFSAEVFKRNLESNIPEHIKNKYFYDEKKKTFHIKGAEKNGAAFKDNGNGKMTTKLSNIDAARDMVAIAESRGWSKIKLSGTAPFRRAAWLEASLKGIETQGYKPKSIDLAELKAMQDKQRENFIENIGEPETETTVAPEAETTVAPEAENTAAPEAENTAAPEAENVNNREYFTVVTEKKGFGSVEEYKEVELSGSSVKDLQEQADKITFEGFSSVEVKENDKSIIFSKHNYPKAGQTKEFISSDVMIDREYGKQIFSYIKDEYENGVNHSETIRNIEIEAIKNAKEYGMPNIDIQEIYKLEAERLRQIENDIRKDPNSTKDDKINAKEARKSAEFTEMQEEYAVKVENLKEEIKNDPYFAEVANQNFTPKHGITSQAEWRDIVAEEMAKNDLAVQNGEQKIDDEEIYLRSLEKMAEYEDGRLEYLEQLANGDKEKANELIETEKKDTLETDIANGDRIEQSEAEKLRFEEDQIDRNSASTSKDKEAAKDARKNAEAQELAKEIPEIAKDFKELTSEEFLKKYPEKLGTIQRKELALERIYEDKNIPDEFKETAVDRLNAKLEDDLIQGIEHSTFEQIETVEVVTEENHDIEMDR